MLSSSFKKEKPLDGKNNMNHKGENGVTDTFFSKKVDLAIFATYFCVAFAVTLPVDLMPMIAAEQATMAGPGFVIASFVATTASVSTFSGGCGKLVNGLVCQILGGRQSSSLYLIGMALSLLGLSWTTFSPANVPSSSVGLLLGCLEFFSSLQWTACSLVLSNHYRGQPARFAAGITTLTLASTCGTLTAKAGGTALLYLINDWRKVARIGSAVAAIGSLVIRFLVSEHNNDDKDKQHSDVNTKTQIVENAEEDSQQTFSLRSIKSSFASVVSNRLFWLVGLAHSTALMTRSADRVLGSFVLEATNLPRKFCGGLTASMTLGFLAGLSNTKRFHAQPNHARRTRFLARLYFGAVLSVLGLALCAGLNTTSMGRTLLGSLPHPAMFAAVIAAFAFSMSFHLSFQVYQIPAMVSNTLFANNRAVCLSLLDAFGFFLASPVWAATSKMISVMGDNGWIAAWTLLGTLFAVGGTVMVRVMPTILRKNGELTTMDNKKM